MKRPLLALFLLAFLFLSAAVVAASMAAPDLANIAVRYAERPHDVTDVINAGRAAETQQHRQGLAWKFALLGMIAPLLVVGLLQLQARGAELAKQLRLLKKKKPRRRSVSPPYVSNPHERRQLPPGGDEWPGS